MPEEKKTFQEEVFETPFKLEPDPVLRSWVWLVGAGGLIAAVAFIFTLATKRKRAKVPAGAWAAGGAGLAGLATFVYFVVTRYRVPKGH